jgi:hypothetical protein
MSPRSARLALLLLLLVLLFGTLMPGAWKTGAEHRIGGPLALPAVAHVALFAAMAWLLPATRWWRMAPWHTPALGLLLALVTEGLQFLAVDRHPNLAGLVQDMAGTLIGWACARPWRAGFSVRRSSRGST